MEKTTARVLLEQLKVASLGNLDAEVVFGTGDLTLYRRQQRGSREHNELVQVEFNEIYSVDEGFAAL